MKKNNYKVFEAKVLEIIKNVKWTRIDTTILENGDYSHTFWKNFPSGSSFKVHTYYVIDEGELKIADYEHVQRSPSSGTEAYGRYLWGPTGEIFNFKL